MEGHDARHSSPFTQSLKEITQLCFPNVFGKVTPLRGVEGGRVRISSTLLLAVDQKLAKRSAQDC